MMKVIQQIQNTDQTICNNIAAFSEQRGLLSQNLLAQLRNLVEGVSVLLHTGAVDAEFNYVAIESGLSYVRGNGKLNFLGKFHKLIQISASHYTLDGDASERLMLKYYEYLHRIRSLLLAQFGIAILPNLENFPVDLDPSLQEYHKKIAERIDAIRSTSLDSCPEGRYYIHKTRPFFVGWKIYYEVTFYRAVNKVSKFDRIIAFTDIDMTDKYAAMLKLHRDTIEVIGQTMPIMIIREWRVSIRPCEFSNFSRLLGFEPKSRVRTNSMEYVQLMLWLTNGSGSLIDLIDMNDVGYNQLRIACTNGEPSKEQIFLMLDAVRRISKASRQGINVLRYLMLRMNNQILKAQYDYRECGFLSGLNLKFGCIPFDTMPFCTSLPGHNPRYWDLVESLNIADREHELLARRINNNVERQGVLYTSKSDLSEFENVDDLIVKYNFKVYHKHIGRKLLSDKGQVFIKGYEDDTSAIVMKLQSYTSSKINGYTQAVENWLASTARSIDDPVKENALKQLFSNSSVSLIYGAAGTGKSTMVDHIAHYFKDKDKLFLAHTNPAIDNLERKVTAQKSEFKTIRSHIYSGNPDKEFDLLVIDECSTVSNVDLLKVLECTKFKLLVLVGDIYQIESIQFGNWFGLIRSFIPNSSVFELTTPFRAKNPMLLEFWDKVRNLEEDIEEIMARNGYSTVLDKKLFESLGQDEIILCLNYDGLYGINNINRFLQSSNPGDSTVWRETTYKIGDPVLFHDSERFRPVIYNNLKGWIVGIVDAPGWIQFDVELDRPVSDFDVDGIELVWVEGSTVRFTVYDYDASDDDDDSLNITVPFQVAYAVSIHKAQGLEYDSVKIVITDANEDDITHSIFYTAITRARERLQIFWTPETQKRVLERLDGPNTDAKDVNLLANRRGLIPV